MNLAKGLIAGVLGVGMLIKQVLPMPCADTERRKTRREFECRTSPGSSGASFTETLEETASLQAKQLALASMPLSWATLAFASPLQARNAWRNHHRHHYYSVTREAGSLL